jgi:hypothetical protein
MSLRKLAREMDDNGLLDHGVASAIECTKGVKQEAVRAGNRLLKEQANELFEARSLHVKRRARPRHFGAFDLMC